MATPFLGNLYNADTIANLEAQYGLGGSGLPSQARHQVAMNELSQTLSPGVVPEWIGDVGAFTAGAIAEIPDFLQTGDWRESGRDIKDNFIGSFLTSQDETPEDIYAKIYAPQKQYQKGIAQVAMQKQIQQAEAAQAAARQAAQARQVRQNIQRYGGGDRPDRGMNAPGGGKGQSPTGGNVSGTPFNMGGLAYLLAYGGLV